MVQPNGNFIQHKINIAQINLKENCKKTKHILREEQQILDRCSILVVIAILLPFHPLPTFWQQRAIGNLEQKMDTGRRMTEMK